MTNATYATEISPAQASTISELIGGRDGEIERWFAAAGLSAQVVTGCTYPACPACDRPMHSRAA